MILDTADDERLDVRDILSEYGVAIPTNVAKASYHYGFNRQTDHPDRLVMLVRCGTFVLTEDHVAVYDVRDGDGVLVEHTEDEADDFTRTYYTMDKDEVSSFVADVVTQTDFAVDSGDEEYLPGKQITTEPTGETYSRRSVTVYEKQAEQGEAQPYGVTD